MGSKYIRALTWAEPIQLADKVLYLNELHNSHVPTPPRFLEAADSRGFEVSRWK